MVPTNWKRLLELVSPPPAMTPRVMVNRGLLWAKALVESKINRNNDKDFIVISD